MHVATRLSHCCTEHTYLAACLRFWWDATAPPLLVPAEPVTCMGTLAGRRSTVYVCIWALLSTDCPACNSGFPLPGMRTPWRVLLASCAEPYCHLLAARFDFVEVDVRILGRVQLLDQLRMLIPQQAPPVPGSVFLSTCGAACASDSGLHFCCPCAMPVASPGDLSVAAKADVLGSRPALACQSHSSIRSGLRTARLLQRQHCSPAQKGQPEGMPDLVQFLMTASHSCGWPHSWQPLLQMHQTFRSDPGVKSAACLPSFLVVCL